MVLRSRLLTGLKAAVTPAEITVPATAVVPCFKVKVTWVIVNGSITSLKVAAIFWLMATPVAALAGTVELTVGAVVSGVAPVVKLQIKPFAVAVRAMGRVPV